MKKIFASFLAVIMLISLCSCSGLSEFDFDSYVHHDRYSVGDFEYTAADITSVDIDWIIGSVDIVVSDKQTLSATETSGDIDDKMKVHWLIEDDQLKIKFCASAFHGKVKPENKQLTLEIPAGMEIKIDNVSADITFEGAAKSVDISNVSGNIDLRYLDVRSLELETVSGNADISLVNCRKVDVDSISGNVTVALATDLGATVEFDSVSGKLSCVNYTIKDGKYVIGDGFCSVRIDTVSANATVY
ncbi:MAG: DUF4097 family beta strand repeat-containing protein [Clostridia bacterium]|nr:DUF4097 family beta strand repeat-containing protein [Clostridia bacterium]